MHKTSVQIRPFDAARDTQTLSLIWLNASLLAHPFIGTQRLREQRKLIEDTYLPNSETFVAEISGQTTGFISLINNFVGGLFVSPHWQGKGVGRELIAHALTIHDALNLNVYTENAQAMGFYKSLGFREVTRSSHDDDGMPFENARLQLTR
ncbi:GNAT family N-acetyltransferase [Agrobacterium tumefaciens]|uniref:GNAT family N-acetyltransferase n=1 Tax=Agrobacterium TaxID=357 RepID=UPI0011A8E777|nr:GNAT family N-acetyltransferase [Agrobacterium sp. DE0009]